MLNLATARVTYRFNGQQVAVRESVTLTFVYGDHLGSASVTVNISGTKVSEARYYPYGETRYSSGTTPTSKLLRCEMHGGLCLVVVQSVPAELLVVEHEQLSRLPSATQDLDYQAEVDWHLQRLPI